MNYLVMYAKIVDDNELGMLMVGIYFGGLCETEEEADELATKCVTLTQGGTAIPKILTVNDLRPESPAEEDLPPNIGLRLAIQEMIEQFQKLADRIYENEETVSRSNFD